MAENIEIVFAGKLEGHKDSIYALCAGGKPNIFYSAGGDGMIVEWDLEHPGEGKLVARLPSSVYSMLYFKENNTLVAGCRFGKLYVLDLNAKDRKDLLELKGDIYRLVYSSERNMIAAACSGGYLYRVSVKDFSVISEIHPTDQHCRSLALSPDQAFLASGWSDGKIRIYDLEHFRETESFTAHLPSVFSVLYSEDGKKLISGGRDAQIRIWDATLSYIEDQKIPAHMFTVNDLQPLPSIRLIASASRDKNIKLWDAGTYQLKKMIGRPKLPGHSHSVNTLLWTGFKDYLISAGDDKTILVWGIICG